MSEVYRFVICVDVESTSLEEAYIKLNQKMGTVDSEDFQWESSDEAYLPDGEEVKVEDLHSARMAGFAKLNPLSVN